MSGMERSAEREQDLASKKAREAAGHEAEAVRKSGQAAGRSVERGVDSAQRSMERGAENLKEGMREKVHDAQEFAGRMGDEARREVNMVKRKMKPCYEDFKRTPTWLKGTLFGAGMIAGLLAMAFLGTLGFVTYKGTVSLFQDPVSYQAHKSLDTVLTNVRGGGYGSGGGVMDYMTGQYSQQPFWTSFVPDALLPYKYQSYSTRGRGMYDNVYSKLQNLASTKSYKDSMFPSSSPNYLSRSIAASEDFLSNILHTIGDVSHRAGDQVHS